MCIEYFQNETWKLFTLDQGFSVGLFCPWVTLGEIWGHFWVSSLGGWRPGRLLGTLQCPGWPEPESALRRGTLAVTTSNVVAQRPWGWGATLSKLDSGSALSGHAALSKSHKHGFYALGALRLDPTATISSPGGQHF